MSTVLPTTNYKITIPSENWARLEEASNTFRNDLLPYLPPLTVETRRGLAKLGDRNVAWVGKAKNHMMETPALVPAFVVTDDFSANLETLNRLRAQEVMLKTVLSGLNDAVTFLGNMLYTDSLAVYQLAQIGAKKNVPGAKAALRDLSPQFARSPGKPEQESESEEAFMDSMLTASPPEIDAES